MSFIGEQFIFNYTGGVQTWVVPSNVMSVKIECYGAGGGSYTYNKTVGGKGGYAAGKLNTISGQALNIYIGGKGFRLNGGWNGGGIGTYGGGQSAADKYGGGGATDIRIGGTALSNRIIVAGGGGGATQYNGQNGGGTNVTTTLGIGGASGGGGYYGGKGYAYGTGGYGGSSYVGGVIEGIMTAGSGSSSETDGKCVITVLTIASPIINNLTKNIVNNQIILSADSVMGFNNSVVKYQVSIKKADNNIVMKREYDTEFELSPLLFDTLIFDSNEFEIGTNQILIDMIDFDNNVAELIIDVIKTNVLKLLIFDSDKYKYISNNILNVVLEPVVTEKEKELVFIEYGLNDLSLFNNDILNQIEDNTFKILMTKVNILN